MKYIKNISLNLFTINTQRFHYAVGKTMFAECISTVRLNVNNLGRGLENLNWRVWQHKLLLQC